MKFYYANGSVPCKVLMFFFSTLNLQPEMIHVNPMAGEQLTPEYLKINPQHTVPTIVEDNGFALTESRAILGYVAEKYAPGTTYYPSEPKARAIVNQRLLFDLGMLYHKIFDLFVMPLFSGVEGDVEANTAALKETLRYLEIFIGDAPFMAGDKITIADFSIIGYYTALDNAFEFDLSEYSKLNAWRERCRTEIKDFDEIDKEQTRYFRAHLGKD